MADEELRHIDLSEGEDLSADWIKTQRPTRELIEILRRSRRVPEEYLRRLERKVRRGTDADD